MTPYAAFARTVADFAPRTAVVLGSGLAGAITAFVERDSVGFSDIPGLVPPTIHGHDGRLTLGEWSGIPILLFLGRLHFYEGHNWKVVTDTVRTVAELGVKRVVLTNASGGIHPSLAPGDLMAIRGHLKLLDSTAWRDLANYNAMLQPYSSRLRDIMREHGLQEGVYAALTGPSYETPAEIRALAACGADAVGMSTAKEAEEAARLELEVAAISCITNKAAGLGGATLDHAEVLANAKLALERLGEVLWRLIEIE